MIRLDFCRTINETRAVKVYFEYALEDLTLLGWASSSTAAAALNGATVQLVAGTVTVAGTIVATAIADGVSVLLTFWPPTSLTDVAQDVAYRIVIEPGSVTSETVPVQGRWVVEPYAT